MIYYNKAFCVWLSGTKVLRLICVQRVFKVSFLISLAAALFGLAIHVINNVFPILKSIMPDMFLYTSFSSVLGFFLVFRTGQAYSRFAEGATLTHVMSSDFLDAAALLFSLSRSSKAGRSELQAFRRIVLRLFSCLNSVCLAELAQLDLGRDDYWTENIIDIEGLDAITAKSIQDAPCKPECAYQRIQAFITDSLQDILHGVPAPLLTRAFQELGQGMIRYQEAMKLVQVPFPFPFVAITECLLYCHTIFTPLLVGSLPGSSPYGASAFSFIAVFSSWTLYGMAAELDNPFGTDVNDLDLTALQNHVNLRLVALFSDAMLPPTRLSAKVADEVEALDNLKAWRLRDATITKRETCFTKARGYHSMKHALSMDRFEFMQGGAALASIQANDTPPQFELEAGELKVPKVIEVRRGFNQKPDGIRREAPADPIKQCGHRHVGFQPCEGQVFGQHTADAELLREHPGRDETANALSQENILHSDDAANPELRQHEVRGEIATVKFRENQAHGDCAANLELREHQVSDETAKVNFLEAQLHFDVCAKADEYLAVAPVDGDTAVDEDISVTINRGSDTRCIGLEPVACGALCERGHLVEV